MALVLGLLWKTSRNEIFNMQAIQAHKCNITKLIVIHLRQRFCQKFLTPDESFMGVFKRWYMG